MAKVRIIDVAPYTGEYDLDLGYLTMRDLRTIKQLSGVRPPELADALRENDGDVVVALAVIALRRDGQHVEEDVLWDANLGSIVLDFSDEGDAVPPPPANGSDEPAPSE